MCGSQNCFCCYEELVCPIKQSGSTESCAARSRNIDLYCDEMSVCLENSLEKTTAEERCPTFKDLEKHVISDEMMQNATKPGKMDVIDMTFITRIRQKFYDHMEERKKNFQFAVFKFGPSDSYWDPTIDDSGLYWSGSQLVVEETGNNWQASAYASCEDSCHTEAAIINEDQTYGFHHMLSRECEQQPPHILNIYSFNSPCITTPGFGCQELIQKNLLYFFSLHDVDCNKREWQINIAWTMQFRDQTAQQCLENWEAFEDDMEEHPNVKVAYGRQSVGKITG